MRDFFIWNARKNGSVRASRIRNFTINEEQGVYLVIAWISDEETLKMGLFENEEEAQKYLESIHKKIEESCE